MLQFIHRTTQANISMSDKFKPLQRSAIKLAEQVCQTFRVDLPAGIPAERVVQSDTWSVVGGFIGRGDIIIAIDEAGCVLYELLCREGRESNATGFVSLSLLRTVELTPIASGEADKLPAGHSAQWLGDAEKWAAMRGTQVLRSGFLTKGDCLKYFGSLALVGAV